MRESVMFRILFRQSVEGLWPEWVTAVEAELKENIRQLLVDLAGRHRQGRTEARASSLRRDLLALLEQLSNDS